MPTQYDLFDRLALCIEYPDADWQRHLELAHDCLRRRLPEAANHLAEFRAAVGDLAVEAAQELFTQNFDHSPAHALEIGWHLFGEDYHRGALLVRLRRELRQHHISESLELPDHLSHVLRLLGKMPPRQATEFSQACVIPAVGKLIDGLQRDASPFTPLVQAIADVIADSTEHGFEEIGDGHSIQIS